MTNSIWKTPVEKPDIFKPHRILVIYEAHDEPELMFSTQYDTLTDHRYVNRWCYWDEFIAAADRAERLQKAVDCALEELQRVAEDEDIDWLRAESARTTIDEIKQLIKGQKWQTGLIIGQNML